MVDRIELKTLLSKVSRDRFCTTNTIKKSKANDTNTEYQEIVISRMMAMQVVKDLKLVKVGCHLIGRSHLKNDELLDYYVSLIKDEKYAILDFENVDTIKMTIYGEVK